MWENRMERERESGGRGGGIKEFRIEEKEK